MKKHRLSSGGQYIITLTDLLSHSIHLYLLSTIFFNNALRIKINRRKLSNVTTIYAAAETPITIASINNK